MTSKLIQQARAMRPNGQFPDFPLREDMNNPIYLYIPGYLATLRRHLGSLDTTMALSETPPGLAQQPAGGHPDPRPDDRLRRECGRRHRPAWLLH